MSKIRDVNGAAEHLGVLPTMVRRLVHERRIPYHKIGRLVRFRVEDLDAFLEANRVPSADEIPRRGVRRSA